MSEPVRRSREIEDFSKRNIIAPGIDFIVPILVKLRLSPNMVSILGMSAGVYAAYILSHYQLSWVYSVAGLAMLLIWHILDGADGRVARLTGKQSEFGKIVDGICDYVVFISIYVMISLSLVDVYGNWIWAVMVFAGLCHAVQAGAFELQRQEFEFWGRGKKSAELPDLDAVEILGKDRSIFARLAQQLDIGYSRMQYAFSGLKSYLRPSLYAHMETLKTEEGIQQFRDTYRAVCAKQVLKWGIMCPHYRSFTIVAACLLQRPELYFIVEAVVLPLVHIYLVKNQNTFNETLLDKVKEGTST